MGELEKADGGTLFLDELGELPMALQAKVLRALEDGEVQPLGSNRAARRVDVRLLCATNRDLPRMVREGRFRDDLYYRIGIMTIELPPLRSYRESLEVLAHVFRQRAAERHGREVSRIAPAAMALLATYQFPGNMRELRNAMEHAVILADGDTIEVEHLPRSISARVEGQPVAHSPDHPPYRAPDHLPEGGPRSTVRRTLAEVREEWVAPFEARYLADLLVETRGSVRQAAERAGVDAVTLYRLLRRAGRGVRPPVTPGRLSPESLAPSREFFAIPPPLRTVGPRYSWRAVAGNHLVVREVVMKAILGVTWCRAALVLVLSAGSGCGGTAIDDGMDAAVADLRMLPRQDLVMPRDLTGTCSKVEDCIGGATAACCDGRCTDVMVDPGHCGRCGVSCGGGMCCTGVCADTNSDVSNCGACGKQCTAEHGKPGCNRGMCFLNSCDPGWADCSGGMADGCETPPTPTSTTAAAAPPCAATPTATPPAWPAPAR